jgi:hypothetical protein
MPRRDTYLTDDDDDAPRRGAASGGGMPGWVWVAVGGGALAVLVVVGLGLAVFSRREAMVRHEVDVARADMMRAEVQARRAEFTHDGVAGPEGPLPVLSLTRVTNAYKSDRGKAEERYTNRRVRVRVEVKAAGVGADGEAWVGAPADLGAGVPRGGEPNVVFRLTGEPVAVGTTVVLEGRCDGLLPHPRWAEVLTFTDCRPVEE